MRQHLFETATRTSDGPARLGRRRSGSGVAIATAALLAASTFAALTSGNAAATGVGVASTARAEEGHVTLLAGRILDSAPGSRVEVLVFPALPASRDFYPVGVDLDMKSLTAQVAQDGTYRVQAPAKDLVGYVDRFGISDLLVTAIQPTDDTAGDKAAVTTQTIQASARLAPQPALEQVTARLLAARAQAATVSSIIFDAATGIARVATGEHPFTAEAPTSATVDAAAPRAGACRITPKDKHYGRPERFMYADNWKGAKYLFTQTKGTSHTLGIAIKPEGKNWSASAGSTKSIANEDTDTLDKQVGKWARNKVNYQDFYMRFCPGPGGIERTERRPTSQHSLLVKSAKGQRPFFATADCQPVGTNYTKTKNEVSNAAVSAGVNLGVVSVSAQSGFSDGSSWYVDVSRRSKMCFSNIEGPVQSRYVRFMKRGNKASGSCRPARATSDTGQRGCTT